MTRRDKILIACSIVLGVPCGLVALLFTLLLVPNTRYYEKDGVEFLGRIELFTRRARFVHFEITFPNDLRDTASNFEIKLPVGQTVNVSDSGMNDILRCATRVDEPGSGTYGIPEGAKRAQIGFSVFDMKDGRLLSASISELREGHERRVVAVRREGQDRWLEFPLSQEDVEALVGPGGRLVDSAQK